MAELKNLEQAKAAFATVCRMLDKEQWNYNRDDEKLSIKCGARGEDLPMDLEIKVDVERMLIMVLSPMPYVIQDDKRLDVAIAISAINNILLNGCFDYDVATGHVFFRMTNSIIGCKLGEEAMHYLLYCACQTIDEYNDKLLMLAKGILSLEKFLEDVMN